MMELIQIQTGTAGGQSISSIPNTASTSPVPLIGDDFQLDLWYNGLCFASLFLSLSAAMVAVLVKQWLLHYTSFVTGSPRERSKLRHFRFMCIHTWGGHTITGLLPYLLHISLFLFFGGTCLLLHELHEVLFWLMVVLTTVMTTAYLLAHILPLVQSTCPYQTPVVDDLYQMFSYLRWLTVTSWCSLRSSDKDGGSGAATRPRSWSMKELEKSVIAKYNDTILAQALVWLYEEASNSSVSPIVAGAVSCIPNNFDAKAIEILCGAPGVEIIEGSGRATHRLNVPPVVAHACRFVWGGVHPQQSVLTWIWYLCQQDG